MPRGVIAGDSCLHTLDSYFDFYFFLFWWRLDRPDVTFAVDWALTTHYLSVYLFLLQSADNVRSRPWLTPRP